MDSTVQPTTDMAPRVIELAAKTAGVNPVEVTIESSFVNDLNFDSLDKVEFAMEVEEEFELSVADEDIEKLQTVGDVVRYIQAAATRAA